MDGIIFPMNTDETGGKSVAVNVYNGPGRSVNPGDPARKELIRVLLRIVCFYIFMRMPLNNL